MRAPTTSGSESVGRARRVWRALGSAYRGLVAVLTLLVYAGFGPIGYGIFGLLLLMPSRDEAKRARRLQWVISRAFRFLHAWLRFTRLIRFDRKGVDTSNIPHGPCVVVSNHQSLTDVTSILATLGGATIVLKPTVHDNPMIRPLMHGARMIAGARNPLEAGRVVEQGVDRLSDGFKVVYFPEGTRSPKGEIGPFGRAAFEIACRARVPLVPIAIRYEPVVWLSKEVPVTRPPYTSPILNMTVLPAVDPGAVSYDSRELRKMVEAKYRRLFAGPAALEGPGAPPREGSKVELDGDGANDPHVPATLEMS